MDNISQYNSSFIFLGGTDDSTPSNISRENSSEYPLGFPKDSDHDVPRTDLEGSGSSSIGETGEKKRKRTKTDDSAFEAYRKQTLRSIKNIFDTQIQMKNEKDAVSEQLETVLQERQNLQTNLDEAANDLREATGIIETLYNENQQLRNQLQSELQKNQELTQKICILEQRPAFLLEEDTVVNSMTGLLTLHEILNQLRQRGKKSEF